MRLSCVEIKNYLLTYLLIDVISSYTHTQHDTSVFTLCTIIVSVTYVVTIRSFNGSQVTVISDDWLFFVYMVSTQSDSKTCNEFSCLIQFSAPNITSFNYIGMIIIIILLLYKENIMMHSLCAACRRTSMLAVSSMQMLLSMLFWNSPVTFFDPLMREFFPQF